MSSQLLTIESALTIENCAAIHAQMCGMLNGFEANGPLTLDLGSVTEFDAAGLQLLLVFAQAGQQRGVTLQLNRLPQKIADVLLRYNVSHCFSMGDQA